MYRGLSCCLLFSRASAVMPCLPSLHPSCEKTVATNSPLNTGFSASVKRSEISPGTVRFCCSDLVWGFIGFRIEEIAFLDRFFSYRVEGWWVKGCRMRSVGTEKRRSSNKTVSNCQNPVRAARLDLSSLDSQTRTRTEKRTLMPAMSPPLRHISWWPAQSEVSWQVQVMLGRAGL